MFGVYVHIPYCLQRCVYCDFATVEKTASQAKIVPPNTYVDRVKKEILIKGPAIGAKSLDTLYFGGGTPSAIEPRYLIDIVKSLSENGFSLKSDAEVTLEINPGTLLEKNFEYLFESGFNRFSVGVQSFDDKLLKMANRVHTADDTRRTLRLLKSKRVNYSADILFALPTQTKEGLKKDIEEILEFSPSHISPYFLTVPEGHPFSKNRAPEEQQVEMFSIIEENLKKAGFDRYEISNFSKPGFESRHNLLYWTDEEYWGLGLSAHSYLKNSRWGTRFWNVKNLETYSNEIEFLKNWNALNFSESGGEILQKHQALTDYFHTSLRMQKGLNKENFKRKFGKAVGEIARKNLSLLKDRGLIYEDMDCLALTEKGILLSNQVFEELTFLTKS